MKAELTTKELEENKLVDEAFQQLLDAYLATKHRRKVDIITKAFNFARQAHKDVRRLSGEPYIMHPISVARIVCEEVGLGSTSICAALLHDVVEDTDYTIEDIENIFGAKVAQIVDGLTKIAGGIFGDKASIQAESFKKLLLTMSDDIRVILIKISDRLHNMRTLGSQKPSKQYKIAGETLYIYAPLANRLGLYRIKEELENLSFSYEHPEEYRTIKEKLEHTQEERDKIFNTFTQPIREKLDEMEVNYQIKARIKTPYSIWRKMQAKSLTFEEIYDILAVRIIFSPHEITKELNQCFDIYLAISQIYESHPDRLRDWVTHPKTNGYQALHVTLMSNNGQWIEVQVRSERMNEMAEQGFSAHWKYKEGEKDATASENELEKWLHTIKEILDDPQPDALDFLDAIKLNLYASEIFVFTPKGEIRTMPQNCTALDFAFSVHTFLGSHCIGAKVNHKLVPLSHVLQSGDQVEILTSKSQRVQPKWLNYATTAKSKGKILAVLRKTARETRKLGEERLQNFFNTIDHEMTLDDLKKLCQLHGVQSRDELVLGIGDDTILLGEMDINKLRQKGSSVSTWRRYIPFISKQTSKQQHANVIENEESLPVDFKKTLKLDERTIARLDMCEHCNPIPGDDVLGYVDEQNHITIHKRQCTVATRLKSSFGNRILAATWDTHKTLYFPATLYVSGIDRVGVLHRLSGVLANQLNIGISKMVVEAKDGIFKGSCEINVHDVDDLRRIVQALKMLEEVKEVTRIN